jgi:uncharacterized protein YdgA (DUF945 family)
MRRLSGGLVTAAVLVFVLVVILGPPALGHLARTGYEDLLAVLLDGMPESEVVQNSYSRGWFGSNAVLELLTRSEATTGSPGAPMRIRLDSRIEQGPLVWFSARFPPVLGRVRTRAETAGLPVTLPLLFVTSDLSLDGSALIRVHAPPGETPVTADALGLRHGGLDGVARLAANGDVVSASVGIPDLELLAPGGPLGGLADLRLEAVLTGPVAAASSGSVRLDVARGQVDAMAVALDTPRTAPSRLFIKGLSITVDQVSRDGLLDLRLTLSASETGNGERIFGPSEIGLAFERMDIAVLGELAEALRMLGSGRVAQEMQGLVMAGLVASLAPRLIAGGAGFNLDPVKVQTPDGVAMGRLDLRLDPDGTLPRSLASGVGDWLSLVRADGEIRLPEVVGLRWLQRIGSGDMSAEPDATAEAARADAQALLESWIADGWAARREGYVTSALRLGDGLLTINGKTVPVP